VFVCEEIVIQAIFRFYSELNDFLPRIRQGVTFDHRFGADQSVKHLVEALGVPHTEVDLIIVNGVSKDLSYLVRDGDRVAVYPAFRSIDVGDVTWVRPEPVRCYRFVLDGHLGRLAAYLRMMGFDSLYRHDFGDVELAQLSQEEERVLLTRDRGLLKRSIVTHGYCVRSSEPRWQLVEVLRRYALADQVQLFVRCLACNGSLQSVAKDTVETRLPARTREYYEEFCICRSCDKLYWDGSHVERMRQLAGWAVSCARTGKS
jgi:uncharacterized protein with PIN domain